MKKFIFLSFVFLAWGFYELSGGADFAPSPKVVASVEVTPTESVVVKTKAVAAETVEKRVVARNIAPAETILPKTDETIELVKVERRTLDTVMTDTPVKSVAHTAPNTIEGAFGVPVNVDTGSDETPVIIPSLIAISAKTGATSLSGASPLAETPSDMRIVSGSRVNVRGGPGTSFAVVAGLVKGEAVEVLEDSGRWVRLRLTDGVSEGWVAASLLTKS